MAAKKLKASEKSAILTKMVGKLKKRYGSKPPEADRPVLETFIYAACLEDTTDEAAEAAYARLLDQFHDMNEIRVSLISEIERTLDALDEPALRARRVREGIQHFFEEHFNFDLEPLKKKTQDSASEEIGAAPFVTPFMKNYTLSAGLGAHAVPLDDRQTALLKWVGLVDPETGTAEAADEIKSATRKADVPLLAFLMRQAASEPAVVDVVTGFEPDEGEELDAAKRAAKIDDLIDGKIEAAAPRRKAAPKKSTKKAVAKKKAAPKKKAAKKAAAKK